MSIENGLIVWKSELYAAQLPNAHPHQNQKKKTRNLFHILAYTKQRIFQLQKIIYRIQKIFEEKHSQERFRNNIFFFLHPGIIYQSSLLWLWRQSDISLFFNQKPIFIFGCFFINFFLLLLLLLFSFQRSYMAISIV